MYWRVKSMCLSRKFANAVNIRRFWKEVGLTPEITKRMSCRKMVLFH